MPARTHGQAILRTPEYHAWQQMKDRCFNSNNSKYPDYGGRGIVVCDRWRTSFDNFLEDMGERPKDRSIDRIDNNGPYDKLNCRWATKKEQARNKRTTRFIQYMGEVRPLAEWSEILDTNYMTLLARFRRNGKIDPPAIQ
jgi:hypothetical protein